MQSESLSEQQEALRGFDATESAAASGGDLCNSGSGLAVAAEAAVGKVEGGAQNDDSDYSDADLQRKPDVPDHIRELFLDSRVYRENFPDYMADRELVEQLHDQASKTLEMYDDPRDAQDVVYNPNVSSI